MAEGEKNIQEKNQKPTQHRLKQAQKKGQLPSGQDFQQALLIGCLLIFLWAGGDFFFRSAYTVFLVWHERLAEVCTTRADFLGSAKLFFWRSFQGTLLLLSALWGAALLGGFLLQRGVQFHWDSLKPQVHRISLSKGLERIFSTNNIIIFTKNFVKLFAVLLLFLWLLWDSAPLFLSLIGQDRTFVLSVLQALIGRLALLATVLAGVFALSDYGYQWYAWFKKLFMSRQEIVDEQKETERNPKTSERQKRLRSQLIHMRTAQEKIPDATVLITNPVHYAVALLWVPHRMIAPEVLVKGEGQTAQYMKKIAKQHGIVILENKPLAQSLYRDLKPGETILPQHYRAVASIIRYVMDRRQKERLRS